MKLKLMQQGQTKLGRVGQLSVSLYRDFLINGWCIGTFFLNFLKVEIIQIPFSYILEKINKNYERK